MSNQVCVICDGELYLSVAFNVPLDGAESQYEPRQAPDDAVTSQWQVTCTNDHVLATSEGEYAMPFTFATDISERVVWEGRAALSDPKEVTE